VKSPCERIPFIKLQTQSKLYSISSLQSREECNWMCSFYHPYYGCISFVNIYKVKFHKEGSTILLTVNTFNIYSVQYVGSRRKLTFREG
jgi:hypothetical protein